MDIEFERGSGQEGIDFGKPAGRSAYKQVGKVDRVELLQGLQAFPGEVVLTKSLG